MNTVHRILFSGTVSRQAIEQYVDEHAASARTAGIFGRPIEILAEPLVWLRNGRRGICILDWKQSFDRLRHLEAVAIAARIRRPLFSGKQTYLNQPHEGNV